ncbi:MAG: tetratricopeptide repeat protein [Chloroflexi bacterium]|nr:tetratricopeptide repeat protein [Chloroflexota bacterium]
MQCPTCDKDNPDGARFCLKCGAGLARRCSQCGVELPADPETRFCPACGTEVGTRPSGVTPEAGPTGFVDALQRLVPQEYADRLLAAGGPVTGERRLVTILFSDVKGSTALAEKLDPEDVLEIMNGAFAVLIPPIYRYEGTLARLMGDAILAFFGAPIAHEDDPERAIRAGLDILAGAREYAGRLERERGIAGFNVRVGIHTGLVVVGEVGTDLRVEYTAMGDAVNLAARMESAAEPGTMLITEDTHKLVAQLFETQTLGPLAVKGKSQAVPVYRVRAARPAAAKPRGIVGLTSPLVGRQTEFAALQEALARLQAGVGGIVTLVGEAGLGKSRLVAEWRASVPDGTVQWVEGRCLSYGTSIAYLLWLDLLRGLLGVTLEDTPQAVLDRLGERVTAWCPQQGEDLLPYLARLMALPVEDQTQARLDDLDGRELKARTCRAVETLVAGAARERPLVLVGEDLHWADPSSLELLERVLALTDRAALLVICLFRPVKEHGCWRIKETAVRTYGHRHTDLGLAPLSPVESQTLVQNLLCVEDLPRQLRGQILSVTEGNPFYVEEVLRALIDAGTIVHDEATGRWVATHREVDIAIPNTLQGVLMARMDRLQEETRRILQLAAVIGRIFLYRVLAALAEEEQRLAEHLITLQREEMIRERTRLPELEYIFKHELTREAAYQGLLKKERRVYHRQVAEALERLFPDRLDEQVGLLAYHWERAADILKAAEYLQRAGDRARGLYAPQEAIDYYRQALALLPESAEHAARRVALYERLGDTLLPQARWTEAREAYTAMLAAATADKAAQARAWSGITWIHGNQGRPHAGLASARRAAEAAQAANDARFELANALRDQVLFLCQLGDAERGLALAEQALALHTELGTRGRDMVLSLYGVGFAHEYLGHHEQAMYYAEEALTLARDLGDRRATCDMLAVLSGAARERGDYDMAVEYAQESLAIARELGNRGDEAQVLQVLGQTWARMGEHEQAARCYEQSLAIGRETGALGEVAGALNLLGELARQQGDYERAQSFYEESLELCREMDHRTAAASALHNLGHVALHQGDGRRVAALFAESLALYRDLERPAGLARCLAGLAGVAGAEGQPARAARLFGAAEALLEAAHAHLDATDQAEWDHNVGLVRAQLDEETLAAAWAEGREMPVQRVITYALSPESPVLPT